MGRASVEGILKIHNHCQLAVYEPESGERQAGILKSGKRFPQKAQREPEWVANTSADSWLLDAHCAGRNEWNAARYGEPDECRAAAGFAWGGAGDDWTRRSRFVCVRFDCHSDQLVAAKADVFDFSR